MNLILIFIFGGSITTTYIVSIFILLHGVLSSFFFFLVDQVQKRAKTRSLVKLSGAGVYSQSFFTFIWASLLIFRGFPIFIKFYTE